MMRANDMGVLLRSGFAFLLSTLACAAAASPTDSDYKACHKQGVFGLHHCLDQAPGLDQPACWNEAHAAVERCYAEARDAHDPAKLAERQRAAEAAERARKNRK
jgi:hypothetical protein